MSVSTNPASRSAVAGEANTPVQLHTNPDVSAAQRRTALVPIEQVAERLGLSRDDLEPYGRYKAKVHLDVRDRLADRPSGKYVVVSAITPTPLGEGKTVTAIGLTQALQRSGHRAVVCLRQPSQGPTFGLKGGGAGGGAAHLEPFEDVNLHLTGDIHAVGAAHNLLAAALDAHLTHGNDLDIDPFAIELKRVVDVDDRSMRHVVIGLGGYEDGVPRETAFDVTAASEVMAILALATDLDDLRTRLARMVVAYDRAGTPVTAGKLKVAGAMAVLLKDAMLPNLVQTSEGGAAFVHAGPFGNIAHGNSSIVADQIALKVADFTVTEAGFGADLGLEKFADIKCRTSSLAPDCVVLVATVRALRYHGATDGRSVAAPDVDGLMAVQRGCANLARQVQNAQLFGVPVVVAINRFPTDTELELALVREQALAAGAYAVAESTAWLNGGAGATDLAAKVVAATETPHEFRMLYPSGLPARAAMKIIATQVYGADGVKLLPAARSALRRLDRAGFGTLPVCMAKTHLSLSHDPKRLGAPTGFTLPIRDVRVSAGAGFLYALCGEVRTMPGLPRQPAFERIDLVDGQVVGLV